MASNILTGKSICLNSQYRRPTSHRNHRRSHRTPSTIKLSDKAAGYILKANTGGYGHKYGTIYQTIYRTIYGRGEWLGMADNNNLEDLQKQVDEWQYSAYALYDTILDLRKKLHEVEEENVLLKKQLEAKCIINSEQVKDQITERFTEWFTDWFTEQFTERFATIPNAPKRGAKRKADDTTRQYIHELRKYNNSLQAIADETGMSKTQVHAILKEPEQPGRWYSVEADGNRKYYSDYDKAIRSKKEIMYEVMTTVNA